MLWSRPMGGDFRSNGNRRVNFLLFVVWSALVVDRWLVVAWTEKSCFRRRVSPAEEEML